MKSSSLLRVLLLALPLSLAATPSDSILIIGKSVRTDKMGAVFTGSVSVLYKSGADRIEATADEIVLDQSAGMNLLKCSGNATIQVRERTVRGQNIYVELGDTSSNIYFLNPNGITLSPAPEKPNDFETWAAKNGAVTLPKFDAKPVFLPQKP